MAARAGAVFGTVRLRPTSTGSWSEVRKAFGSKSASWAGSLNEVS